jgi:hypothetical protein
LICSVVGKWNELTCDEFYKKLAGRLQLPTRKYRIDIYSDGNKQNITGIQTHFPSGSVNYGIKKKIYRNQKIVGLVNKKVLGNPLLEEIAINNIDGMCSKLRERLSCFTRLARTFAKRKCDLNYRLEIFSTSNNFIEKKCGKTPAMQEGISQRVQTWSAILHKRLSYLN